MKPNSTKEKFIKIRKGILDKKDKLIDNYENIKEEKNNSFTNSKNIDIKEEENDLENNRDGEVTKKLKKKLQTEIKKPHINEEKSESKIKIYRTPEKTLKNDLFPKPKEKLNIDLDDIKITNQIKKINLLNKENNLRKIKAILVNTEAYLKEIKGKNKTEKDLENLHQLKKQTKELLKYADNIEIFEKKKWLEIILVIAYNNDEKFEKDKIKYPNIAIFIYKKRNDKNYIYLVYAYLRTKLEEYNFKLKDLREKIEEEITTA